MHKRCALCALLAEVAQRGFGIGCVGMHRHGRWYHPAWTVLEQQADTLAGAAPSIAVSSHLHLQPPFILQALPEPACLLLHMPLCRDHATCPGDCSQQDFAIFPHDFPISISLCGGMGSAELQDSLPAGRNLCRVEGSQEGRLAVFSTDRLLAEHRCLQPEERDTADHQCLAMISADEHLSAWPHLHSPGQR